MSATGIGVDDDVHVETPRGEPTIATVVDREPTGTVGSGPSALLTVELNGVSWRVDDTEADLIDE
ncbi:hypothetical protein [Halorubrum trueperi]|uniref:Uncharacterized protein n=1 Tax=Halorubrum trueperi TaxID=2004704 RepID=A0ABD5UIK2_9EURY